jgi:hypothetical protein
MLSGKSLRGIHMYSYQSNGVSRYMFLMSAPPNLDPGLLMTLFHIILQRDHVSRTCSEFVDTDNQWSDPKIKLSVCVLHTTGGKNCSRAKTAHGAPSEPQHTTIKERKKALTVLPCLSRPYPPAASFSSTMRTSPTKLAGDLTHIPINTPIEAICEIWFVF